MTANPTRRTLAKASAWAVPAIVTTVAAPAYAASLGTEFQVNGYVSFNRNWQASGYDYSNKLKIYSTTSTGLAPTVGYLVKNTTTSTTITDASVTFWLAHPNLRFSPNWSYHNPGWTTLTRDSSQEPKSYRRPGFYNAVTYYAYTTLLTSSVQAQQGTTPLPIFAFQSLTTVDTKGTTPLGDFSYNDPTNYFFVENRVVVNGTPIVKGGGPVAVRLQ